jgi:hypothetical protein
MIESTACEESEYTTINIKSCWVCASEYCEKCADNIIDSGYKCGHQICNNDYCKDKHFWHCNFLKIMYQERQNS